MDVLSGGTWLAVRGDGRFAAVTNQRALAPPAAGLRSRGLAVKELAASRDPLAYVNDLDPTRYASMNLAWGDASGVSIAYARNEGAMEIITLPVGVHVLCNDRLGAEGFPRGERLTATITDILSSSPPLSALLDALGHALADHHRVPLEAVPPSHLPPELARELTAGCIHSEQYGTRSATLFAAGPAGALAYRHSDGPPCTAPFVDRMTLLEAA